MSLTIPPITAAAAPAWARGLSADEYDDGDDDGDDELEELARRRTGRRHRRRRTY